MDHTIPYISAVLFLLPVFAACAAAINRTFNLGLPTFWVEEISIYCIIWSMMLMIGQLLRKGMHTQFTLLLDHLPVKGAGILRIVIYLFCLIAFFVLALGGWKSALESMGTTFFTLNVSMFIPFLSIPVGAAFCILETLMLIAEEVAVVFGHATPAPDEIGGN